PNVVVKTAHHSSVSPIQTPSGLKNGSIAQRPASIDVYFGRTTMTSWPRALRYLGRAPTTSASPPDLMNGTASDPRKASFRGGAMRVPLWNERRRIVCRSVLVVHLILKLTLPRRPGQAGRKLVSMGRGNRPVRRPTVRCRGIPASQDQKV